MSYLHSSRENSIISCPAHHQALVIERNIYALTFPARTGLFVTRCHMPRTLGHQCAHPTFLFKGAVQLTLFWSARLLPGMTSSPVLLPDGRPPPTQVGEVLPSHGLILSWVPCGEMTGLIPSPVVTSRTWQKKKARAWSELHTFPGA